MVIARELVCGSVVRVRAGRDFDTFKAGEVGTVVNVNASAETCEVVLEGGACSNSVLIACRYLELKEQLLPAPCGAPLQSEDLSQHAVLHGTALTPSGCEQSGGLVTLIGPVLPCYDGLSKWKGSAMAPNGKLYCAPYHAHSILAIEVGTQQLSHIDLGAAGKGECKWSGIAAGIDGCLYCAPCSADSVLVIDPEDESVSYITGVGQGPYKWSGIVSSSNGLLYCAPASATTVLVIDPRMRQLQHIPGAGSGGSKWSGIAEGPNGNLYCAPSMAMAVLEINRASHTLHRLEGAVDETSYKYKWSGIARACDGLLYCAPYNASSILVIDALAGDLDFVRGVGSGDCKWSGIGPGLDGRLYCVPSRAQEILVVGPGKPAQVDHSFCDELPRGHSKWSGICVGLNANLYCTPYNSSSVMLIRGGRKAARIGIASKVSFRHLVADDDTLKDQKLELCMAFQALLDLPEADRMAQYRSLCRQWHPDKNLEDAVAATEIFQLLQQLHQLFGST